MTKHMRQLDGATGDPMFAAFAQMRICALLDQWIREYPTDFAVRGTAGALNALAKLVISHTHLLQYGCDLLSFIETLPTLVDEDFEWALPGDDISQESDRKSTNSQEEEPTNHSEVASSESHTEDNTRPLGATARERASSLLMAKALAPAGSLSSEGSDVPARQQLKDVQKLAFDFLNVTVDDLAIEWTRILLEQFLRIKVQRISVVAAFVLLLNFKRSIA